MKTIEKISEGLLEAPIFKRKKTCPECDGTKFERKTVLDGHGKHLVQMAQCKDCGEMSPIRNKKRNPNTLQNPEKMKKILQDLLKGME